MSCLFQYSTSLNYYKLLLSSRFFSLPFTLLASLVRVVISLHKQKSKAFGCWVHSLTGYHLVINLYVELETAEELYQKRITRILTTDFPQYFAIVTRVRQESSTIGPDGGMISSTVVPQVQAVFPEGSLTKHIKVGLQVVTSPLLHFVSLFTTSRACVYS